MSKRMIVESKITNIESELESLMESSSMISPKEEMGGRIGDFEYIE